MNQTQDSLIQYSVAPAGNLMSISMIMAVGTSCGSEFHSLTYAVWGKNHVLLNLSGVS